MDDSNFENNPLEELNEESCSITTTSLEYSLSEDSLSEDSSAYEESLTEGDTTGAEDSYSEYSDSDPYFRDDELADCCEEK